MKNLTVSALFIIAAVLSLLVRGGVIRQAAGGQAGGTENGIEDTWTGILGGQEGKLNRSGNGISGTWTQTGVPAQPLTLERSAETSAPESAARNPPRRWSTRRSLLPRLFNMVIPISPTAFKADGKWHLVYELHLSNMDKWEYRFTRIEVVPADATAKNAGEFFRTPISMACSSIRAWPTLRALSKLSPGEFGAVFMWVTFDSLADVPAAIEHRISVKIGDYPEAYVGGDASYQRDQQACGGDFAAFARRGLAGGEWAVEYFACIGGR